MKTSTFSIMITCIVACASLLLWSCNKDDESLTISVASEDVDAFYAASVLRSKSIEELPENISKEEIANMALKLAKEKYKTDDVIINDLYVYPDVDGVEFFYKLPSGLETNALFIDIKNIEDIAIESEQFEIASDNYDSHLTLDGSSAVLKTKDMLNNIDAKGVLFTCDNQNDCSPCKVIAEMSDEITKGRETWLFIEKGTEPEQVLEDVLAIEEFLCDEN